MSMLERAKAYIIKAATIILVCNTVVQLMQTFNWQFQVAENAQIRRSWSTIAHPFAYLLIPIVGVLYLAAGCRCCDGLHRQGERGRHPGRVLRGP